MIRSILTAAAVSLLGLLPAKATTLTYSLNVDNAFTAYISTDNSVAGTNIGSGSMWPTTYSASATLIDGVTNYLHIAAVDFARPAMLLGLFTLSDSDFAFANGTQRMVSGDPGLTVSDNGWSAFTATANLGPNGTSPWGLRGPAADARYVWHQNPATSVAYFTAMLSYQGPPVTETPSPSQVPLPAGLPLILTGLLGLGVLRRRQANG